MSQEYEIEVSNGTSTILKISVEEGASDVLMLHIKFPTSGERVTFSRKKTGLKPRGSVNSGSLTEKDEADRPRDNSSHARKMKSITDTGGLMLTYGDPKDPHMP